jgi:membrane AbrB-like protein
MPEVPTMTPVQVARSLLIGLTGGAVAAALNVPLAWMLGSLIAAMLVSLGGMQVTVPRPVRSLSRGVVGILLGASVTQETISRASDWPVSLLLLILGIVLVSLLTACYYRYVAGFNRLTALSASLPGALNTIPMLAIQLGANPRQVVLPHLVRVTLVMLLVPPLFSFWQELSVPSPVSEPQESFWFGAYPWVLLTGIPAWFIARKIRLPIPDFLGPLLISAVLSLWGYSITLPIWLFALTFVVLGTSIGARFHGMPLSLLLGTGGHALVGSLVVLSTTIVIGLGMHWLAGIPLPVAILAVVPGGVAEMALLAAALGVDPVFVTSHQLFRSILLNATAPLILKALGGRKVN